MLLVGAEVQPAESPVSDLTAALRTHLEDYVADDRIGNGLALMMGGLPAPSIPEYARYLVRVAALLGAERVAGLLAGWARGEPLHYRTCMVLSGLPIDRSMSMDGGFHFTTLPQSSDALANELPLGVDFRIGIMDMAGATKVAIESKDSPVLFKPGALPEIQTETFGSQRDFLYAEFCEALGLACNRRVSWIITWRDFGDLAVFGNGVRSGHTTGPDRESDSAGPLVSQDQLDHAVQLLTTIHQNANPPLRIPMHRWMSSKRRASLADRFIDLRIALESLYLDVGGSELRFRLATRGAWHLGADAGERQAHYRTLREAYSTASTAVHRGEVESTQENRRLLSDAQDLCRLGILKRLDEAEEPDWNALILGRGPHAAAPP
ncbi:MAG: hypothetical protein OXG19_08875 [Chloroflexi bacterium]|nr:hypothetical protein [Chloroflexota bacterium]